MNKKDTHAFVNQLLVYTLVMICFSGSVGLGTVWLRQQMAQTANSVKQLQTHTAEIERRLTETRAQVASEESPDSLNHRNAEWNLGLVQPKDLQVVRVDQSPEQRLAQKRYFDGARAESGSLVKPVRFALGGSN